MAGGAACEGGAEGAAAPAGTVR